MPLPNYAKYRALINHPGLTDEKKNELIDAWWKIASRLIDAIYDGSLAVSPSETTRKGQKNSSKKRQRNPKKDKLPD